MTFHDPHMAAGGKAVLLTGPFGDAERTIDLDRPMAVAEIIAAHELTFSAPTIAVLDGEPLLRGCWAVRIIRPGEVIAFVAVPRGGGQNAQGKQIVGMIAALALSIAAPMAGAALFGAGSMMASVASAAFLVGGSMLLNALMPPPVAASNGEADPVYSVNAASNQATPLDIVPVLYGRLRYPPRHASAPYSEYAGNDQYLYQLFLVTAGKASLEKIEIGDTQAWSATGGYSGSFTDLEFQIIQPGQDITLFPANVVTASEVGGQTVPDPGEQLGPYAVNAAGTVINRIALDFVFPLGLFDAKTEGGTRDASRTLVAQYRRIDNNGNPLGGWSTLFQEKFQRNTRTPQRMSRAVDVPEGRYEVSFAATDADTSGLEDGGKAGAPTNRVQWVGLRGYVPGFVTPPNCTLLAMKVRANEQLSQYSTNQIFVTAERYLPVWNGSAWTEQKTRSIAWAAADLLMNGDYSIGLSAQQFDLAQLAQLATTWANRDDTFNAIFDRSWTVQDALRAILRAGRTQAVRLAGRIGFVRLEPKLIRRAVFSARNVVRGSFQHKLVLFDEEKPDSVIGSFVDETVWQTREVKAGLASIGSDAPQKIEWFGITNHAQAWRESITEAAVNAFNREFVSFTADWEGKLLVRGEPILVQHPFIQGVEITALADRAGDVLTIDRDLEPIAGEVFVIVRGKTGHEWGPCRVASIAGRSITLDATDRSIVASSMGSLASILPTDRSERAMVLVCEGETRPFNGLVVSAVPNGQGRVDVTAVIDAPEVYLADGTELMPSPWTPPTLPPQNPAMPVILSLFGQLRAGLAQLELEASWEPAPGTISGYVAEVSYDDDALPDDRKTWVPVYRGDANRFTAPVLPQPLVLRVAAIGVLQGPWTRRVFVLGDVPNIVMGPFGPEDLTPELRETFEDTQAFLGIQLPSITAELSNMQAQLADLAGAADYDASLAYDPGDLVKFDGGLYRALQAVPAGTTPTEAAFWEKIGDYASIGEAVAALAGQLEDIETQISAVEGRVTSGTRSTRRIQNALLAAAMLNAEQGSGQVIADADQRAATATVSETIRTEVSRIDGTTTALAEQIDVVESTVNNNVAQAIQAVTTQVQEVDGKVTAQATRVDELRVVVGNGNSTYIAKTEVVAAPAGYTARHVMSLKATGPSGTEVQVSIFFDIAPDGTARIGFAADQTVFFSSAGVPIALVTGAGKLRSANGAVEIDMITGNFSFGAP